MSGEGEVPGERLIHYSDRPLLEVHSALQTEGDSVRLYTKPNGLWVSVGTDWERWCREEEFSLDRLACESQVILRPEARILRIRKVREIDAFDREYQWQGESRLKLKLPTGWPIDENRFDRMVKHLESGIDWPRLAQCYQGIVIAPYLWQRRLTLDWYYPWDCASGCIWDAAAVQEIRPAACPSEAAR